MGAKYKFDGSKLTEKYKSTSIANVRGDKICAKTGTTAVATVRGSKICDKQGYTAVANVHRNGCLCSKTGSSKICKMKDIHNEIEGPGEEIKAALWLYFVK
jgi:hypothetical protein